MLPLWADASSWGYISHSRKAASGVMRLDESSMPLQSGKSRSVLSVGGAGSSDFLIKLVGAVCSEELVNFLSFHIKLIPNY